METPRYCCPVWPWILVASSKMKIRLPSTESKDHETQSLRKLFPKQQWLLGDESAGVSPKLHPCYIYESMCFCLVILLKICHGASGVKTHGWSYTAETNLHGHLDVRVVSFIIVLRKMSGKCLVKFIDRLGMMGMDLA